MEPIVLALADQLAVSRMQVEALVAQNKINEYRTSAEAELKKIQEVANSKNAALMNKLSELAKAANLELDKVMFNFDTMTFSPKAA